jgi:hypothetical protein
MRSSKKFYAMAEAYFEQIHACSPSNKCWQAAAVKEFAGDSNALMETLKSVMQKLYGVCVLWRDIYLFHRLSQM